MDKIDVCVVRSSSRFYAAREPPLWRRNGFDIRYSDGLAVCVDREESMRGEGRARGDSGQRGNIPHSACACVIDVRARARSIYL